ncbi:MAG: biopolymer transporter ExbD [Gemmatimonadaceae bacterium]
MTAHGNINLVPLVDILTSIVFFSLLTYTGATLAALTAFDLSLPPTVVSAPSAVRNDQKLLNLLLAVRIDADKLQVEHSEGMRQQIAGLGPQSMDQLEALMKQVRARYPQNADVLVVPTDEVSYDDVIHVLERLKLVGYRGISLGTRARGEALIPAARLTAAGGAR